MQKRENCDIYSKTFLGFLSEAINTPIADSKSFKSKVKIIGKSPKCVNEKDVEIALTLTYLSTFWRTTEILWINYLVSRLHYY